MQTPAAEDQKAEQVQQVETPKKKRKKQSQSSEPPEKHVTSLNATRMYNAMCPLITDTQARLESIDLSSLDKENRGIIQQIMSNWDKIMKLKADMKLWADNIAMEGE